MKYEYKVISPEMSGWVKKKVNDDTKVLLNELGQDGWELVSVTPVTANMGTSWGGTTANFVFFFKRLL